MKTHLKKRKNRIDAGLMLIMIFSLAVTTGLMAEHERPVSNVIRSTRPAPASPRRKPDSESPPPQRVLHRRDVIVAVIDTGIDLNHPDLRDHAWNNPGETGFDRDGHGRATNGLDDDGNGLVDDAHGYDFAGSRGQVTDTHGHGTHIAGIILKSAPGARLMNLKYFNRGLDGVSALANSLKAMRYAIRMKADIINYSGGGTVPSPEELALLAEASRRGILVVAAAGNEASNSEKQPFYPANYELPNILSVTAIGEGRSGDLILPSSNFGVRSVALAAPGKDIESTLPGGRYGPMTGTSQATAFATATAVSILERDFREGQTSAPEELIERIVGSSRRVHSLQGKTRFASKLAPTRALRFQGDAARTARERREFIEALDQELAGNITASLAP